MKEIKEISEEIYGNEKTKSPRKFIECFRANEIEIENADINSSDEAFDMYSRLIADYALSLSSCKNYKKAIPVLNKALNLFEKNKRFTSDTLKEIEFYEELLFNRAICNFYVGKYELAKNDLEFLTRYYPENNVYSEWMHNYKLRKLYKVRHINWYILCASIVVECFFDKHTGGKNIFLSIGAISLVSMGIIELCIFLQNLKFRKEN